MRSRAFSYLRVSSQGQVDGDGFERQRIAIEAYAQAHDVQIVREFREEGVSGASELQDRPALQELLQALATDGVKVVIVEALHRLARDLMVSETIIADLHKNGYVLISATEPDLLGDDPSRKLIRQLLAAISEYEKQMIVLKLRGARQRMKARIGRCEGKKPFGLHPGEQAAINRIMELRSAGITFADIAHRLDSEGLRPRSAKNWNALVVSRIMRRVCQKDGYG